MKETIIDVLNVIIMIIILVFTFDTFNDGVIMDALLTTEQVEEFEEKYGMNINLKEICLLQGTKKELNVIYDDQLVSEEAVNEVKQAINMVPNELKNWFVNLNWSIEIQPQVYKSSSDANRKVVGFTDYQKKKIYISSNAAINNEITLTELVLHEFAHFVDGTLGEITDKNEWEAIYNDNLDYVEYRYYSDNEISEEDQINIDYATINSCELFASSAVDYVLHPEFLAANYPEMYKFLEYKFTPIM